MKRNNGSDKVRRPVNGLRPQAAKAGSGCGGCDSKTKPNETTTIRHFAPVRDYKSGETTAVKPAPAPAAARDATATVHPLSAQPPHL
jgi:hypothetical protein